jgi:hypothetical protein
MRVASANELGGLRVQVPHGNAGNVKENCRGSEPQPLAVLEIPKLLAINRFGIDSLTRFRKGLECSARGDSQCLNTQAK